MSATTTRTPAGSSDLLRNILVADGVVTGATALLLAVAAGPLGDLFDLPVTLLRVAGLALIPYGALVLGLGVRGTTSRPLIRLLIAANLAWVVASVGLLLSGWVDPSGIGIAFTLLQAAVVAAFADLQYRGLRRLG